MNLWKSVIILPLLIIISLNYNILSLDLNSYTINANLEPKIINTKKIYSSLIKQSNGSLIDVNGVTLYSTANVESDLGNVYLEYNDLKNKYQLRFVSGNDRYYYCKIISKRGYVADTKLYHLESTDYVVENNNNITYNSNENNDKLLDLISEQIVDHLTIEYYDKENKIVSFQYKTVVVSDDDKIYII